VLLAVLLPISLDQHGVVGVRGEGVLDRLDMRTGEVGRTS
jgi:hypothetical protein